MIILSICFIFKEYASDELVLEEIYSLLKSESVFSDFTFQNEQTGSPFGL